MLETNLKNCSGVACENSDYVETLERDFSDQFNTLIHTEEDLTRKELALKIAIDALETISLADPNLENFITKTKVRITNALETI